MNDCLYEAKLGFTPGYSCESQVITVFQEIANHLEDGVGIDAITIEFSKAFKLLSLRQLLRELAAPGADSWEDV
jgi:hypothetical protein